MDRLTTLVVPLLDVARIVGGTSAIATESMDIVMLTTRVVDAE